MALILLPVPTLTSQHFVKCVETLWVMIWGCTAYDRTQETGTIQQFEK